MCWVYEKQATSEIFCQATLKLKVNNSKALVNLVMALSSCTTAKSVVGLFVSALYHFQYSSICDVISNLAEDKESYEFV